MKHRTGSENKVGIKHIVIVFIFACKVYYINII